LAYFAFQGYYESQVKPLWEIFERLWMPLLILSPIYVWLTDRLMGDPLDGLYQVGLAVTGLHKLVQWPEAQHFALPVGLCLDVDHPWHPFFKHDKSGNSHKWILSVRVQEHFVVADLGSVPDQPVA
jgi:hypothetical protein